MRVDRSVRGAWLRRPAAVGNGRRARFAPSGSRRHGSGAIASPRLALPALAGLLARAALVVGVDTGLVHLAAALGTPTVSLFVATDPALAGVERAGALARDLGGVGSVPTPDEVLSAAGALLQRAPRC